MSLVYKKVLLTMYVYGQQHFHHCLRAHHLHAFSSLLPCFIFGLKFGLGITFWKNYAVWKYTRGLRMQTAAVLSLMLIMYAALHSGSYWRDQAFKVHSDTFGSSVTTLFFLSPTLLPSLPVKFQHLHLFSHIACYAWEKMPCQYFVAAKKYVNLIHVIGQSGAMTSESQAKMRYQSSILSSSSFFKMMGGYTVLCFSKWGGSLTRI